MSAFICNPYHISVLAEYAYRNSRNCTFYNLHTSKPLKFDHAEQIFDLLNQENYNSVNYRYQEQNEPDGEFIVTAYERFIWSISQEKLNQQIIQACFCSNYQSCEHPDYHKGDAYHLLEAIKGIAIRKILGDDLDWELTPTDGFESP